MHQHNDRDNLDERDADHPGLLPPGLERYLVYRGVQASAALFLLIFLGLLFNYPITWAVISLVAIGTVAGLFTTHFVLGIRQGWRWWALVPLTGAGWLAFLLGLFAVFAMTRRDGAP